jgi:hypothetical protein
MHKRPFAILLGALALTLATGPVAADSILESV